jgi:hypothetical protein
MTTTKVMLEEIERLRADVERLHGAEAARDKAERRAAGYLDQAAVEAQIAEATRAERDAALAEVEQLRKRLARLAKLVSDIRAAVEEDPSSILALRGQWPGDEDDAEVEAKLKEIG